MSIPVSTLTGSNTINQMMYNVNTIKDLAANSGSFDYKANSHNAILTGNVTITSNTSIVVPKGTTAQRSSGPETVGAFRYNTESLAFEGYGVTGWGSIGGSSGAAQYKLLTGSYTANTGDRLACDTSSGVFTVTLPGTPAEADIVEFIDKEGTFATNNLTIARNGSTIEGLSEDVVADVSGSLFYCQYDGSTWQVFGLSTGNVSLGGDLSGFPTNAQIVANAVDTTEINDSAVTTAKINDLAVTTAKINALAVTTAKIDNGAVTYLKVDNTLVSNTYLQNAGYASTGKAIAMAIVFG